MTQMRMENPMAELGAGVPAINSKRRTICAIKASVRVVGVALLFTIALPHIQADGIHYARAALAAPGAIDPCPAKVPYPPAQTLDRNDDRSSDRIPLPSEMSPLDFLGRSVDALWVNNNGNVTFDGPLEQYTPFTLLDTNLPIIAPYFADVDTRSSDGGQVSYGVTEFDGRLAFCVTWDRVGYYSIHTDKTATFQLLLVSRSNQRGDGSFDIIFNYDSITWEAGDESGGTGGLGGTVARLGYANGSGTAGLAFEFAAAGQAGALIDGGRSELRSARRNSDVPGRLIFEIREGSEQRTGGGDGDDDLVYAALGDSYSSGVGTLSHIPDKSTNPCYRTSYSYGALLFRYADELNKLDTFINATCSGAVTYDIVRDGQHRSFSNLPTSPAVAQIEHLDETVDLITLTIGGNDVGFAPILSYCLVVAGCHSKFREAVGGHYDPNEKNIEGLYSTLFDTYRAILAKAPNASVFVLGYPTILSNYSEHEPDCFTYEGLSALTGVSGLDEGEVSYFQRLGRLLNSTIASAAADAGVRFVDIAASNAGQQQHGVCSPLNGGQYNGRYINNVLPLETEKRGNFFHPNRAGHEDYLAVLLGCPPGSSGLNVCPTGFSPLDFPINPSPLIRRGESPPEPHFFKIGFVFQYGGWLVDDVTGTYRPVEDELVADFDLTEGRECRLYSSPFPSFVASCKIGLQVSGTRGETWRATVYSDPVVVASGIVEDDGSFEIVVDDLVLAPGSHTLVVDVEGPDSTEILIYEFFVDSISAEESEGAAVCPSTGASHRFTDVAPTSFASDAVACIYELRVTVGRTATTYDPGANVNRAEMAAFLSRLHTAVTGGAAPVVDTPFTDTDDTFARDDIARLYGLNVTVGRTATTYDPGANVNRAVMAVFLSRLHTAVTGGAAPVVDTPFTDTDDTFARDDIARLYGLNVIAGRTATTYDPGANVNRAEMAVFLSRLHTAITADPPN